MIEKPVFRNIQHVPKVWGVTYIKLFATLGSGLIATTLAISAISGSSAIMKVVVLGFGAVFTLGIYALCLWIDSTDSLERDSGSFLRKEMNSQSLSLQQLRFFDEEAADALSRPGA